MFGFLKDKLKKVISGIGDKLKRKPSEKAKEEIKEEEKLEQKVKKPVKAFKEELKKEEIKEAEEEVLEEGITEEKEEQEETAEEKEEEAEELIKEKEPEAVLEAAPEAALAAPEKKKGFFARLTGKIKDTFQVKLSEENFSEFFSELEMVLMENSVAMEVIDALKEKLKKELVGKPIKKSHLEEKVKEALANSLSDLMIESFDLIEKIKKSEKPYVIAFFGINGSGKTTTIAKIAHQLKKEKMSCVLAASDTFRAASIEQLEKHANALGVKMIKHKYNADPAAVAFDAIAYAKSHAIDAVLIDTAGRMHTESNLMKEMEKIVRVTQPNTKIFIGEAIVGNDAVEQARAFNDSIGIDAIILNKADVDEKGGACISVSYVTGKPILYLGVGQEYDDLEKFNKQKIIESLGLG